ncbi:MAG: flavodoxin family protein [Phycisphaerae bacterium]|nr:flavodoxin family protein [Phycisphaerae bacterium]
MKAVVILGSRNPDGQTATAAGALAEGLRSQGADVAAFYLPQMHIESCRQCDSAGWGVCRQEGRCVIEDDLDGLVDAVAAADVAAFATPVYFADLSESMKAFTDRLRRCCVHKAGKAKLAGTRAVGVCVAGGSGGGAPNCCARLHSVLELCGLDVVDMIPVRRQNLTLKCRLLTQTGAWLVAHARGEQADPPA